MILVLAIWASVWIDTGEPFTCEPGEVASYVDDERCMGPIASYPDLIGRCDDIPDQCWGDGLDTL